MLNSTFRIVAAHPVTIPPLLVTVWVVYQLLKRNRTTVLDIAKGVAVIMIGPVFLLSFLAEFTNHPFFQGVSEHLIQSETVLIDLLVRCIDAVVAAELHVVLVILSGSWDVVQGLISSIVPVMKATELLLTMFGFEFFAGAILIYTLSLSSGGSDFDFSLKGIGVVLLISGLFATLLQLDTWQVSESLLLSAFVAAMLGFALGVAAMILLTRPNFGGKSVASELHTSKVRSGEGDGDLHGSWVVKTMSLLRQLVSKRQE